MTTTREIVTAALQRIRVVSIGSGETASAEIATYVLGALNDMMHGWQADGVDVKHADLGLDDEFFFVVPPAGIDSETVDALASQGTWDASTNTPTLTSGTGTQGHYYKVSVAGSTTLDDVTSWVVNDVAVFDGVEWLKGQYPRKHEGGIIDMLASAISEDFGKPVSQSLARSASNAWTALQADCIIPGKAGFDTALVRTTTRRYEDTE